MDTRNTTLTASENKLRKTIAIMEILGEEDIRPVVGFLSENDRGSFVDLLMATNLDPTTLELALDQLLELGMLFRETHLYGVFYYLERRRLAQISALARRLVR